MTFKLGKGAKPATVAVLLVLILGARTGMAYEEPRFEIVADLEGFEVRRYEPYAVAEVEVDAAFEAAGSRAFDILFGYISGANEGATKMEMTVPVRQAPAGGEKMEMTVPVVQRSASEADVFAVSFVLPLRFDAAAAPRPTNSRVRIREVPPRLMAALRYTGFWSEARYREHESALLEALEAAGYEVVGPPEWARYNAPFTPWFLRRNEVLIEVRKADGT